MLVRVVNRTTLISPLARVKHGVTRLLTSIDKDGRLFSFNSALNATPVSSMDSGRILVLILGIWVMRQAFRSCIYRDICKR